MTTGRAAVITSYNQPLEIQSMDRSRRGPKTWAGCAAVLVGLERREVVASRSERSRDPRGQLHRRRITVVALFFASGTSAILSVFAPVIGVPVTAVYALALGVDLVLLARRQQDFAEREMAAAFRSRATRTKPNVTHSRPGS